jgi:LTXXQ motif family protein
MKTHLSRLAVAALALPVAIPLTVALAQTQVAPPSPPSRMEGRSPEVRARLFDGRMAMIKESLKLNQQQLSLWAPVEDQLRASFTARQKARAEREARHHSGERTPLAPPDRLDRSSHRATERAERLKALAEAFRPFYAALSEEQKAVASVVLRPAWRDRGFGGRRWHMRRASAPQEL